ncbi:MAG TPA: hypothetical protein VHY22_01550 [Chthoniobacteraceae bacterium]|jgi:uncharacterized membrane protein|nr:hypothetical protein [Chthoniobacteraceae bacterium]
MTPAEQSLVFTHTPASLAVSAAFVLAVAWLCWTAWKRSAFRRSTGLLEGMRLMLAAGIAITLNQPEWREVFKPQNKPELAVLIDTSRSMQTRDMPDTATGAPDGRSRAEAAKPLADIAAWKEIAKKMDVTIEPFSSDGQPPDEGTDLNKALIRAAERHPRLAAVVLASDGDWNTGQPPAQAAVRLRMRHVPVYAAPMGSETRLPDVALTSFDVPAFAVAGKPLRIPFSIESSLPRDEPATLRMECSSGETIEKPVVIPAMSKLQDVIVWKPEAPGDYKLKLIVPPTGGERNLDNNSIEAPLPVRKEELRVLVIDTYPRWEYRYLRNALQRDPGVVVNTLLFHPDLGTPGTGRGYLSAMPGEEELSKYDVVFLGDVGTDKGQLTLEQCAELQKLVRDQAAGLVFLPGFRGYEGSLQGTPLADLMPIVWDDAQPRGYGTNTPGNFTLTEEGTHSLLTKLEDTDDASARVWATLPGFQWYAPVIRAKAGSDVLATHASEENQFGRIPLIVTKTYGSGKILFMGTDGAWRWRKGVEDKYHYRFWGQVVRWMAYQRNMAKGENMRLFYSPDRPRTGAVLTLNANVAGASGDPLHDGVVIAQITAPSGKTASVRLSPAGPDAWGLFTGVFTPTEPGDHRVHLTCAEAGSSLDSIISVQGASKEKVGEPARLDVLREIAQITRGAMLKNTDPATAIAAISALPEPALEERRVQIWASPLWAGFLILLLGIFWAGRKAAGTF